MGRIHLCDGEKHKERLMENFPRVSAGKKIIVLDIPDEYQYMDEELMESIKASVSPYLDTL